MECVCSDGLSRRQPAVKPRAGFTLVEVLVALIVFSIGVLGVAASSAALARQLTISASRGNALSVARARAETSHGSACTALASGSEWRHGVHSEWEVSAAGGGRRLNQRVTRNDPRGRYAERFLSAVSCE